MVRAASLTIVLLVALASGSMARAQAPAKPGVQEGVAVKSHHASGTFEVKVTPLPQDEKVAGLALARYAMEKQLKGDLEGTSKAEMMAPVSAVEGSGGAVAVEQVTGTLGGRSGSFTLLHQSTMRKGAGFDIVIKVVPDSGTGQLAGLAGTMKIIIADGKHSYEFDYSLPDAH
jgi:hypothetical protein